MILDTNALSAFVDGDEGIASLLGHASRACVPVIVLGEFRYGIAASRQRARYEAWLAEHLPAFDVLPVDQGTASAYAALRVQLRQQGTPIPANDAWIASLALQHRLPVASRDAHFDAVPGLRREAWSPG